MANLQRLQARALLRYVAFRITRHWQVHARTDIQQVRCRPAFFLPLLRPSAQRTI